MVETQSVVVRIGIPAIAAGRQRLEGDVMRAFFRDVEDVGRRRPLAGRQPGTLTLDDTDLSRAYFQYLAQ